MKIGIYQRYWGRVGGGQRYIAVVAEVLARRHDVEIVHHAPQFAPEQVGPAMDVDLSRVAFRYAPPAERPAWPTRNPLARLRLERDWQGELSAGYDVYIDSSDVPPFFCHARRGVLLVHFPLVSRDEFHGRANGSWSQQPWLARAAKSCWQDWEWRARMSDYDLCLANSEFTRGWIQRRWGLDARVVNPPLRGGLAPGAKENLILTIGAFHHAQHKRHDVLIQEFAKLCEAGLRGWKYVIVGACGPSAEDRDYFSKLEELAAGLPIDLRTNVRGDELRSLLGRASILWHSMGYGIDPLADPHRMEHFGMVVTEAQSAGCVPIVFRGGGLPEIVTHNENGMLWSELADLHAVTRELTESPDRLRQLAAGARRRSADYGVEQFESNLMSALEPVLT